ncbi:MAG: hypothetical protein KAW45_08005 [Thermoplasmatales archaeon]|nr:hypothetical protein [Thermoplasmatales archaeon]
MYTGEAAGLQDLLWGFGMRYAINSGFYAALSINENKSYKRLIKKYISGRLKTSVVNRYFQEKYKDKVNKIMFRQSKKNKNWIDQLHIAYNPTWYSKVFYPYAKWFLTRKYKRFSPPSMP